MVIFNIAFSAVVNMLVILVTFNIAISVILNILRILVILNIAVSDIFGLFDCFAYLQYFNRYCFKYNGDYLAGNELANKIYAEKYYTKDLKNQLIENCPEDVFKRLASFIATVEPTKSKQYQLKLKLR